MDINIFLQNKKMKSEKISIYRSNDFTFDFRFKHFNFYHKIYYICKSKKLDIMMLKIKEGLSPQLKKKHLNFSILLTNDEDISMVNNKFRKLNMPTNVLSFESNLNPKNFFKINEKEVYLGDIIISMERIFYESKINNMYFNDHFIHIFMHGILHVLGYDHKTDNQQQEMEQKEISILNELGIENPYE
tara:strand:- start:1538 stop:2101 length:564 start_codon:yes stop_codon:yes gene_type:complete